MIRRHVLSTIADARRGLLESRLLRSTLSGLRSLTPSASYSFSEIHTVAGISIARSIWASSLSDLGVANARGSDLAPV